MASLRDQVVAKVRTQLGVRYYSMHTGPKGSGDEGFGCAALVAWALNQVLGTSYIGGTFNFWGEVIGAPTYNQGNTGEFETTDDPQPGDIVCYFYQDANIGYSSSCGHVAMYIGDGKVIGAMGQGTPGSSNYLNIGVSETTISKQSIGGVTRYIRCTRLDDESSAPESYDLKRAITVQVASLNVRSSPVVKDSTLVTSGGKPVQYKQGDVINIDAVVFADGRLWGHYVGGSSGKDRYVSLGTLENAR